ncbi:amidase family protein [Agrobacterium vitis]|uniref:amidase family protein n=1 Tax=Agrobacterium vitis TaxID=373 RepID=UPI0018D246D4
MTISARRYLSNLWWTNFVGCPAITIPAGVDSDGLPIGLQIVGRPDDDDNLLRIAAHAVKALP